MNLRRLSVGLGAPVFALMVIAGTLGSCSSDETQQEASSDSEMVVNPTAPASSGDACSDPEGDLDKGTVSDPAILAALPGIDLVETSARPTDDHLVVDIKTAGPINLVPGATFYVAQGQPLDPLSFEIRVVEEAGNWTVTLVTWSPDEKRVPLDVVPSVDDNELSFSVPLDELPPIALMIGFGASVTAPDGTVILDDCSSLWQQ